MTPESIGIPQIDKNHKCIEDFFSTVDKDRLNPQFTPGEQLTVSSIIGAAREIVKRVAKLPKSKSENRTGGILVVAKKNANWKPVAVAIDEELKGDTEFKTKETKHTAFALAKVMFLMQNPEERASGSNASCLENPTDNIVLGKWYVGNSVVPAGAVSFDGGWIIGFSGFSPANIDEAAVLGIAVKAGIVSKYKAGTIAFLEGNTELRSGKDTYLPA